MRLASRTLFDARFAPRKVFDAYSDVARDSMLLRADSTCTPFEGCGGLENGFVCEALWVRLVVYRGEIALEQIGEPIELVEQFAGTQESRQLEDVRIFAPSYRISKTCGGA